MYFKRGFNIPSAAHAFLCLTGILLAQNLSGVYAIKDCGIRNITEGDARTYAPWVAGIYTITKPSAPFKFVITATIIGPSTVLTLFGGSYGSPPRGAPKDYHIANPKNVYVAAGFSSTQIIGNTDEHFQIVEVSYILPYNGHEAENKEFHYFLYHLKTPLNLQSPYVRAVCLPGYIDIRLNVLNTHFLQAGHAFPPDPKDGSLTLQALNVTSLSDEQCASTFLYHYQGTRKTNHVFCGKADNPEESTNDKCFLHGSPIVFQLDSKWFLRGITALIPGRKRGQCNIQSLYIYSKTFLHLNWMIKSIECGSREFACGDGKCIPLSSVCNDIQDCVGDVDEDQIFCDASFRCNNSTEIVCGLNGKCISKTDLCDGRRSCDDASDEKEVRCSLYRIRNKTEQRQLPSVLPASNRNSVSCNVNSIPSSEGVVRTCFKSLDEETEVIDCENAPVGTWVTLKCENFYVTRYRSKAVQMQCKENGFWQPFKPFDCIPDCGIISAEVSPLISNGADATKKDAFPWHAAIFRMDQNQNEYIYKCGASLVDKKALFTAGLCVSEIFGKPKAAELYRVILAPVSSIFDDNKNDQYAKIFEIDKVWLPLTFDARSLNSDIAIIQLTKEVKYGAYIRPVCHLSNGGLPPSVGEVGKISGFGQTEAGELSSNLKYTSLIVVEKERCFKNPALETLLTTSFCAGHNETTLCQGDSGDGLAFGEKKGVVIKYTIKGIASSAYEKQKRGCGKQRFSLFAHVDAFNDWISEILENPNQ